MFRLCCHGEHVLASILGYAQRRCSPQEVTISIDHIDSGQLVSVAFEHSLDRDARYLQTELGIFFKQVARSATERALVGPASLRKFQRQIEESGVLGSLKPVPGITAGFGQVLKNLLRIAGRILLGEHEVGSQPRRRHAGGQSILFVCLRLSAGIEQDSLAGGIDSGLRLIQSP